MSSSLITTCERCHKDFHQDPAWVRQTTCFECSRNRIKLRCFNCNNHYWFSGNEQHICAECQEIACKKCHGKGVYATFIGSNWETRKCDLCNKNKPPK